MKMKIVFLRIQNWYIVSTLPLEYEDEYCKTGKFP